MTTEARSRAARLNGAKSRGPVTARGRQISSGNSIRHGLLARTVVLAGEDRDLFIELLATHHAQFSPRNEVEQSLVENLAIARWRQMRVWALERSTLDSEIANHAASVPEPDACAARAFRTLCDNSRSLDLLNRYETRYDRQYGRCLNLLLKLGLAPDESNPASALTNPSLPNEPSNSLQPNDEPQTSAPPAPAAPLENLEPQADPNHQAGSGTLPRDPVTPPHENPENANTPVAHIASPAGVREPEVICQCRKSAHRAAGLASSSIISTQSMHAPCPSIRPSAKPSRDDKPQGASTAAWTEAASKRAPFFAPPVPTGYAHESIFTQIAETFSGTVASRVLDFRKEPN